MRRALCFALVMTILLPLTAPVQAERDVFPLLDYRTESWFMPRGPGSTGGPVAGLFNPAAFAIGGRAGADFWWNDGNVRKGLDNYGLGFGSGLNFAMNTLTWGDQVSSYKTYDYQLGLAGGSRRHTFGLAYRWANGETQRRPRQKALVLGMISRPGKSVSLGASASWSLESSAAQYIFDLGWRPTGRNWLTLFADWAVNDDHRFFHDGNWSAGMELRPLRGLHLGVRARDRLDDDGVDIVGLLGVTIGSFHAAGLPVWNDDGDHVGTSYLLRSHPPFSGWPVGQPIFGGKQQYLALDLQNRVLTYQQYRYFDNRRLAWLDLLEVLNAVRDDDSYHGVVLNLAGFRGRPSLLWEMSRKFEELRAAGKKIIVHTDRPGPTVSLLTASADHVTMDPQGMLPLPGFALSRSYLKGSLEKLGIGFQEFRYFKYKSAAETLSRDSMSDADREQRQRIVDVIYEEVVGGIAAGRGLTADAIDRVVDEQSLLSPQEAVTAGLVDAVARWEDMAPMLKQKFGATMTGHRPSRLSRKTWDDQWGQPARIPVVFAVGACDMDTGIKGRTTSQYLRSLKHDPTVPAVVLRVDSPGGDPLPSDLVADAVRELIAVGKPVIISQGDVAASGGYWISMDGSEIFTTPVTITGSIGVIGGWVWDDGVAEKLGITSDAVSRGARADLFSTVNIPLLGSLPRRPMNDQELARTKELVLANYDTFVQAVARGRDLSEDHVRQVAQGRVWMGGDAIEHGLCDRFGTLDEAIALARQLAGIPAWQEIEIVEYPPRQLFAFPSFFPQVPSLLPFGDRFGNWLARMAGDHADPEDPVPATLPGMNALGTTYVKTIAEHNGQPVLMIGPDLLPADWQGLR